jgi:hypothetical protein
VRVRGGADCEEDYEEEGLEVEEGCLGWVLGMRFSMYVGIGGANHLGRLWCVSCRNCLWTGLRK